MPAKASKAKKLKWTDTEDIAFRMIDKYPDMNPMRLRLSEIQKHVVSLPDFGDDAKKAKEEILEAIQTTWYEERQDMEDELGPLPEVTAEDEEDLDEDEYRDDKMIDELEDDEPSSLGGDDDEDEEEDDDEFGDGFQEETGDR